MPPYFPEPGLGNGGEVYLPAMVLDPVGRKVRQVPYVVAKPRSPDLRVPLGLGSLVLLHRQDVNCDGFHLHRLQLPYQGL